MAGNPLRRQAVQQAVAVALIAAVVAVTTGVRSATTRSLLDPPTDCSFLLEARIGSFLRSYNGGDPSVTEDHFARGVSFGWYWDGEERPPRRTLEEYFERQRDASDTLEVVAIWGFGYEEARNQVHFNAQLQRNSIDYLMKGALSCRDMRFVVWSMGPCSSEWGCEGRPDPRRVTG